MIGRQQKDMTMETIDHDKLALVEGGAGHKSAARAPKVDPLDPFGVGAFWTNATGAWMSTLPAPFQTPTFPLGY
jgi:hypothetical protein